MSLSEIKRKIEGSILPILEAKNAFLVDVQVRSERGEQFIQALVDTDEGVTIEQCAEISRELSRVLRVQEAVGDDYHLEISSPGIDKPLKLLRQYRKNIGRKYRVRYRMDTEARSLTGTLAGVAGERITFSSDTGEPLTLEFSQIIETKEELPW
ncbi:MAG: ribosome maturation factor RimP [Ignavibacteriales bacterium]|nr:ribosome maturation factor RimP [Ignavibacteriales bacterium]